MIVGGPALVVLRTPAERLTVHHSHSSVTNAVGVGAPNVEADLQVFPVDRLHAKRTALRRFGGDVSERDLHIHVDARVLHGLGDTVVPVEDLDRDLGVEVVRPKRGAPGNPVRHGGVEPERLLPLDLRPHCCGDGDDEVELLVGHDAHLSVSHFWAVVCVFL